MSIMICEVVLTDIVRCECCQGRKKVMGLGMMMKDCSECLGVGFVNAAPKDDKYAPKKDSKNKDT